MELRSSYIDPESSPIAAHHRALAYWNEKRDERMAPTWRDISLLDFDTALIPFINVIDIEPETMALKYRFWGTSLTQMFGGDFTSSDPKKLPSTDVGQGAINGIEKLIQEKKPNCEIREFLRPTGLVGRQIVLRLPLSDDAKQINHVINVCHHELMDATKPVSMFFDEVFAKS